MTAQFQYIGSMFFAAWLMGGVFDVYNTVTGASKWLKWLRSILDLAFWVASAGFVYYLLLRTDSGRFRIYTLALLVLGYFFYRLILHSFIVRSAFLITGFIAAVLRLVFRIVYFVVITPLEIVWRIVRWVSRVVYRLLCWLENGLYWILGFWGRLLTWPLKTPWERTAKFRGGIQHRWEGIWERASKWLKRKPNSV